MLNQAIEYNNILTLLAKSVVCIYTANTWHIDAGEFRTILPDSYGIICFANNWRNCNAMGSRISYWSTKHNLAKYLHNATWTLDQGILIRCISHGYVFGHTCTINTMYWWCNNNLTYMYIINQYLCEHFNTKNKKTDSRNSHETYAVVYKYCL